MKKKSKSVVDDGDDIENAVVSAAAAVVSVANDKKKRKKKRSRDDDDDDDTTTNINGTTSTASTAIPSTTSAVNDDGSDNDDEEDIPLGKRLSNNNNNNTHHTHTQTQKKQKSTQSAQSSSSALSLSTMLTQALQSGDDTKLELVIGERNVIIIRETIKRLPLVHIGDFLNRLVTRFQQRPGRGSTLLVWIRCLLETHASYLVSNPQLPSILGGLQQVLKERLSGFDSLLALSGKLDFVLSQTNLADENTQGLQSAVTIDRSHTQIIDENE